MLLFTAAILTLMIMGLLITDRRKCKTVRVALSPFWYFSFVYLVAFPLRAVLLDANLFLHQVARESVLYSELSYPEHFLTVALLFSGLLWLFMYWGRNQTIASEGKTQSIFPPPLPSVSWARTMWVFAALAIAGAVALLFVDQVARLGFVGETYQKRRFGAGFLWVMPELSMYALFGIVAWYWHKKPGVLRWLDYVAFALMVGVMVYMTGELFSRRILAAMFLCFILLAVMRNNRLWPLAVAGVLATVFASPVLDMVRSLYAGHSSGLGYSWQMLLDAVFNERLLYRVSSAFEGAGHFARLFEQATLTQLAVGIDHGVSWLFNAGLGLFPRSIWIDKPIVYGGMAQFEWLYPGTFHDGFAPAAIPMSFAVDFAFGFGLPFALIMAFVFGRLMGIAERTFWDRSAHPTQIALALFIYVFVFNWVRGGTIIIQSVILFSIPLVVMFGLRPTLRALIGFGGEAVGLFGANLGQSKNVFFFPHSYFRDRQLDTIRNWPESQITNPAMIEYKRGEQVSRENALGARQVSWKTRLPLVNIKRRPAQAPKDAAVYTWGALVLSGPFITDIDNPYAFTAYNTLAVKLFRPLICWFLESPRCLEIRCLSEACREGVRREYGELAYAKCTVAYPKMPPQQDVANEQLKGRCRFLYVSTQFEIKGGAALLNAYERLVAERPFVELDIITHLPDRYQQQASRIPNLRILDADLSREEIMKNHMAGSDVLIHPTYMDSFGMVIAEALSYGLPIIATDVYAIREMVEDGVNGCLIDPPVSIWSGTEPNELFSDVNKVRDRVRVTDTASFEDALYAAMKNMAEDADFRRRAGAASLDISRTKFSGQT